MAQNLSGTPGVVTSITDLSVIIANSIAGIVCVQGVTKRGEAGKEELVTNWTNFRRKFGGLTSEDKFPLYCKQALDNGAKLRVTRAHHYTDIDDITTLEGDKATGNIEDISQDETLATATYTVTAAGADTDTIELTVDEGSGPVVIAQATSETGDTVDDIVNKLIIDLLTKNANGTHGYTAVEGSGAGEIDVTAPEGSGADANNYITDVNVTGTLTATAGDFSGGVDEVIASDVTFTAKGVGSGYDNTKVIVTDSISGEAGKIDIEVQMPDSDISFKVSNVSNNPDSTEEDNINSKLEGVAIDTFNTSIPTGTATLTGGAQAVADIDANDYNGSEVSGAGWHAFDQVVDSMRIANFNKPDPVVDTGLVSYVETRADMRAITRTPLGLNADGVDDYREGAGAYTHDAINSLYADLWYSDAEITDPEDPEVKDKAVSAIGFYTGSRAKTDKKKGEWFSSAGSDQGQIDGINRVPINFIAPGNKGRFDSLYEKGVNAIVNHERFGIVAWGNRTLLKDRTKLTSKQNIADLAVFIARTLKGIAEQFSFQPNDFQMFNELYRTALPFIRNVLVDGRAIQGNDDPRKGEGEYWFWFGDQFAKTPDDLSFNTKADIDAGKYRIRFAFKPIAANEYIAIDVAPADSATIENVQVLQTL